MKYIGWAVPNSNGALPAGAKQPFVLRCTKTHRTNNQSTINKIDANACTFNVNASTTDDSGLRAPQARQFRGRPPRLFRLWSMIHHRLKTNVRGSSAATYAQRVLLPPFSDILVTCQVRTLPRRDLYGVYGYLHSRTARRYLSTYGRTIDRTQRERHHPHDAGAPHF
eukprot:5659560-Pyramimonas_sp.AAC.2